MLTWRMPAGRIGANWPGSHSAARLSDQRWSSYSSSGSVKSEERTLPTGMCRGEGGGRVGVSFGGAGVTCSGMQDFSRERPLYLLCRLWAGFGQARPTADAAPLRTLAEAGGLGLAAPVDGLAVRVVAQVPLQAHLCWVASVVGRAAPSQELAHGAAGALLGGGGGRLHTHTSNPHSAPHTPAPHLTQRKVAPEGGAGGGAARGQVVEVIQRPKVDDAVGAGGHSHVVPRLLLKPEIHAKGIEHACAGGAGQGAAGVCAHSMAGGRRQAGKRGSQHSPPRPRPPTAHQCQRSGRCTGYAHL